VSQTGQYWVQVTANGCIGKDTIQVTFLLGTTKTINAQICEGKRYTLPKGNTTTTSGIYRDTLKNSIGCDSIIVTNLSVTPAPTSSKNIKICSGNFYTLSNGLKLYNSGIYKDTIKINGCDSIITITLNVSSAPLAIIKNAHICQGSIYTLPKGNQVSISGTYKDTFILSTGCDSIIITNLTVHPLNTSLQNIEICSGDSYTLPSGIQVNTSGTYNSIVKTAYNCDSTIITQLNVVTKKRTFVDTLACDVNSYKLPSGKLATQNGTYVDSIRSTNGCDSIITTRLILDSKPKIQLATNLVLCIDSTLLLQPIITNSAQYSWQDGSITPTYLVNNEGTYSIAATNICGETKHTTIITSEDCITCELYVPTAFSPNNDGVNDIITPVGNCIYKNLRFKIFNRWSELVFESNNIQNGWNGFYKNSEQLVDTYTWILDYTDSKDKRYYQKGILTLLR